MLVSGNKRYCVEVWDIWTGNLLETYYTNDFEEADEMAIAYSHLYQEMPVEIITSEMLVFEV